MDSILSAREANRSERAHKKKVSVKKSYDFSKARRNPYAKRLKAQVTIRIDEGTLAYFKHLGQELALPYPTRINLYLRDCAAHCRRFRLDWKPAGNWAANRGPLSIAALSRMLQRWVKRSPTGGGPLSLPREEGLG